MKRSLIILLGTLDILALVTMLPAQKYELATKKRLTLEVAKAVAKASADFVRENNWNVVISIVD